MKQDMTEYKAAAIVAGLFWFAGADWTMIAFYGIATWLLASFSLALCGK